MEAHKASNVELRGLKVELQAEKMEVAALQRRIDQRESPAQQPEAAGTEGQPDQPDSTHVGANEQVWCVSCCIPTVLKAA